MEGIMKKTKYFLLTVTTTLVLSACGGNANEKEEIVNAEQTVQAVTESTLETEVTETEEAVAVTDEMRAEADSLWNAFLEKVSVIETDSQYASILKITQDTAEFNAGYYETATGRSKDEYLNMSAYEQFLWYSTYVLPVNGTSASGYSTYLSSVDKWNSNVVGVPYNWFTTYGTQEMADSYRALMEWDYAFLMQTGSVYNFITGQTSAEENPDYVILDPALRSAEQAAQAQQEVQQLQEELQGE